MSYSRPVLFVCGLIISIVVSGCIRAFDAPCWMRIEEQRLFQAYHEYTGIRLTDDQRSCISNYQVIVASGKDFARHCNKRHAACYSNDRPNQPLIIFRPEWFTAPTFQRTDLARHEIKHRMAECIFGDSDPDHESILFTKLGYFEHDQYVEPWCIIDAGPTEIYNPDPGFDAGVW